MLCDSPFDTYRLTLSRFSAPPFERVSLKRSNPRVYSVCLIYQLSISQCAYYYMSLI